MGRAPISLILDRNLFDVVDNDDLDRLSPRFQLKAELFLDGSEDRRRVIGGIIIDCEGQGEVEDS